MKIKVNLHSGKPYVQPVRYIRIGQRDSAKQLGLGYFEEPEKLTVIDDARAVYVRPSDMLLDSEPFPSHIRGMGCSSSIIYNVDAVALEGGLDGTCMTRAVMMRSLNRIVISSPARTSLALLARTPFKVTA